MRVNVYAEEMTDRVEIVRKVTPDGEFTGLRFYLELPISNGSVTHKGPFIHRPGDDDSAAVTFWGKQDLRSMLYKALNALDMHYAARALQNHGNYAGKPDKVVNAEPQSESDTVVRR